MENATKALLIAAAVLVAILIITLGITVYDMAAETMGSVNFSGQEVQAHNEKFTRYDGEHKRGTEVNAMLKTVLTSNLDAVTQKEEEKKVYVELYTATSGSATTELLTTGMTALPKGKIDTSKIYTITVEFASTGGLVKSIKVRPEN